MYKWKEVKLLSKKGMGKKRIARELKLSINTVRKYLARDEPPEFHSREYNPDILNFKSEVEEMLNKGFIGTRIHKELQKIGYTRTISSVYRYLNKINTETKNQSTSRFETNPGEQMQYDWKEWFLDINGKKVKIYVHQLLLSYSRKKYCTVSLTISSTDIVRAIKEGVEVFGGSAKELLIDNPKQMVINHGDSVRYNDEFLKFCGIYGIEPSACKPYRPRTKGKVERPFFYLQEHFLRGLSVNSLKEFTDKLSIFIEEYNDREHSTLKEAPNNRFWKEIDYLSELPKTEPTKLFTRETRKVSNDGYVSFNKGFYPVPMKYALRTVFCENIFGFKINIYDEKGEIILSGETNTSKSEHPEHKEMNSEYQRKRSGNRFLRRFTDTFGVLGEEYSSGLRKEHNVNVYWHVSEILSYTDFYSVETVRRAIEECLSIGSFNKNSVKRILSKNSIKSVPEVSHKVFDISVDITRQLSVYGGIL